MQANEAARERPETSSFASITLGALALAAVWLSFRLLVPQREDPSEGVYLMIGRLLNAGYPRASFHFDQFWLFPDIVAVTFRLFGDSLGSGRGLAVAISLLGLAGLVLLARELGAQRLAPFAAVAGTLEPYYFCQSRFVQSDLPGIVCVVWATLAMTRFWRDGTRRWLVCSGGLTSAALLIKPLTVVFAALLALSIFSQRSRWHERRFKINYRNLIVDVLAFVVAGFIVAAPFVDLTHVSAEFRRTVSAHWTEGQQAAPNFHDRWSGFTDFLSVAFMWIPLAIRGAVRGWRLHRRLICLLVAGEIFSAVLLLGFPPWEDHYVLLSPALIGLGVVGIEEMMSILRGRARPQRVAVAAMIVWLAGLPWLIYNDIHIVRMRPNDLTKITGYIEQNTPPGSFVVSDFAVVPYLAGRLLPPSAVNAAFPITFRSKGMAQLQLSDAFADYDIAAVVLMADDEYDPTVLVSLEAKFPRVTIVRGDSPKTTGRVFRREAAPATPPP